MNALKDNEFTQSLVELGGSLPIPKAILMISAHWETQGTWLTAMPEPRTIHDFGNFPEELFQEQYPAPGSPELARRIAGELSEYNISLDNQNWGLDHGTWSVLKFIFPEADIPVVQLSLDRTKPMSFHYELGKKINFLRDEGVMIMGSGNIVHNIRKAKWGENPEPYDWAKNFDKWVKEKLDARDYQALVETSLESEEGKLSIPTPEHYQPLLYILGASEDSDKLIYDYEGIDMASMSMRCLRFQSI